MKFDLRRSRSVLQEILNSSILDWVTSNISLSISHSPHPLTDARIAKTMESVLPLQNSSLQLWYFQIKSLKTIVTSSLRACYFRIFKTTGICRDNGGIVKWPIFKSKYGSKRLKFHKNLKHKDALNLLYYPLYLTSSHGFGESYSPIVISSINYE